MAAPDAGSIPTGPFLRIPITLRQDIYRYLLIPVSTWSPRYQIESRARERYVGNFRHLAILRTNRQIHIEASCTLYSELTVRLEPRHIILGFNSQTIWQHDSWPGRGAFDKNGKYVHNAPELDGRLEPHVFARLRRIRYDVLLRFADAPTLPLREDFSIEPQFHRYYTRYICETNMTQIQRFVMIILRSPIIYHLNIDFGVDSVKFQSPKGVLGNEAFGEMQMTANRQVRDMLVHGGVLGPLRALHNVRCFNLGFFEEEKAEGFPVWLAELAKDIKLTVERNCRAEQRIS